jgi:hypothetical protein
LKHLDPSQRLEDIEYEFKCVQEQRQWALTSLWRRNSERKWQEETRAQQIRVASQKRKWRIQFYTRTGKPDKLRRTGHPWDRKAFAGPEHETFFLGGANLMLGRTGESPARMGSEKAINTAVQAVHLQSTINQMTQYGALLKPLFGTMEEAEADLIVNGGFPKVQTVPVPEPEPGADGPVLPPSQENRRQEQVDAGSPVRLAMEHPGVSASSMLALADAGAGRRAQRREEAAKKTAVPQEGISRQPYHSRIPWTLLDELEAEKHKLVTEQVNRLPFERRPKPGMEVGPQNPLVLDPKKAKSMAKKPPVNPAWPKKKKSSLSIE